MRSVNKRVLYTGVTSDIVKRIWEHKNEHYPKGFSVKYNCTILVYYCHYDYIGDAIAEEKRIKAGNRSTKERLINEMNYEWKDLSEDFYQVAG